MHKTILLFFLLLTVTAIIAVPAPRTYFDYTQPDGSIINIRQFGDEWIHWSETKDGYTLLDKNGWKMYAILNDSGDLVQSNQKASPIGNRQSDETRFINQIPKHLKFSSRQIESYRESSRNIRLGSFPAIGNANVLVIPAQFSDQSMSYSTSSFNNIMNNPSNYTGCFKSYYEEVSYNNFSPTGTVCQPVTVSGTHDSYGQQAQWRTFASQAIQAANPYVNFADYDNDGNGIVEGVIIIHAGQGQETSGDSNDIWSHQSNLSTSISADGVTITSYAVVGESGSWGMQAGVGVSAHEFGHLLGLPDYYNTASGDDVDCVGDWDLMSSGSWNNNSYNPAHHNPWSKYYLGWMTREILELPGNYTLSNSNSNDVAYAIETPGNNEWFFLENRQQLGYNSSIPGHGLLVYHVDESYILSHLSSNDVNNSQRKGLQIESANGNLNSSGTPFPDGTHNSFTDTTNPSSLTWNNIATDRPIENISESGNNISFTFWNGPGYNPLIRPLNLEGYMTDDNNVKLEWNIPDILGSDYVELSYSNLNLNQYYTSEDTSPLEVAYKYDSSVLNEYQGLYLHRVRFLAGDDNATYTLKIYNESDNSLTLSQVINEINPHGLTEVPLDNPFIPNPNNNLIIAIEADSGNNSAFGCDRSTSEPGFSDLIKVNNLWFSAEEQLGWNGDWIIELVLTDATYSRSYIPEGYNLYKDNSLLSHIADWEQTYYLEIEPEESVSDYHVTAVYSEGESEPSNTETVNIDFNLSPTPWTDNFENYSDFTQDLYPWHSVDMDLTTTYPVNVNFPGNGTLCSFMIFDPTATVPPLSGNWNAHSGTNEMVAFSANSSNGQTNNDWLISPNYDVIENSAFSFFAKTVNDNYGLEKIRVLISEGSTNPEDFQPLSTGDYFEPPTEWTEYAFSLTDYIGQRVRVAINCISEDATALAIDDCTFDQRVVSNDEYVSVSSHPELIGCYPNPFNPTTSIRFHLSKQQRVQVEIYNVLGQHVKTLLNEIKPDGEHTVSWDGTDNNDKKVSSGIYFYKFKSGTYTKSKKMVLIK